MNALGHSNVICERYCWILDDADVVAVLLKDFVDVSPTRAIHEATVDENYGLNNRFRYCSHDVFLSCALLFFRWLAGLCCRSERRLMLAQPSGQVERLAGNPTGIWRSEKHNRGRNVIRLANPAQRS